MEACDLPGVVQSPARAPNYGRAVNVGAFSPAAPFPALLLSPSEEGLYNARPQHKHAAISARATTTLGRQKDRYGLFSQRFLEPTATHITILTMSWSTTFGLPDPKFEGTTSEQNEAGAKVPTHYMGVNLCRIRSAQL